jgi:uncharacterized protein YidB (DUF937 family)
MRLKLSNLRAGWASLIKGKQNRTTNSKEIEEITARENHLEKVQQQDGLSRQEAKANLSTSDK